jgi:hypothetical protein
VGDTILLAFDQRPDWPDRPSRLRIFVEDAEATSLVPSPPRRRW